MRPHTPLCLLICIVVHNVVFDKGDDLMNKNSKIILLCIILLAVITSFILFFKSNDSKQVADTWGIPITDELVSMINQSFMPVTAMDSEWIYFSDLKSGSLFNSPGYLYRMKHDGTEVEKILDVAARNLYIYDGYLYYSDSSNYSKLYALSLDDFSTSMIYDASVFKFIIVDEWIYICENSNEEYILQLSRLKHDGSDYTVLVSDRDFLNLIYSEGYIYLGSTDNFFSIYRMSVENFELELISVDNEHPYGIHNNMLLTFGGSTIHGLKVLDLETRNKKTIEMALGDNILSSFNFYNDICYGINEIKRELLKITDKGFEIIYNDFPVEYFNVIDDWLFFSVSDNPDNIHENSLYRMNLITGEINSCAEVILSGIGHSKLTHPSDETNSSNTGHFGQFLMASDDAYFSVLLDSEAAGSYGLYKSDFAGTSITRVNDLLIWGLREYNDQLYFVDRSTGFICKMNKDGSEYEPLFMATDFTIDTDNIAVYFIRTLRILPQWKNVLC